MSTIDMTQVAGLQTVDAEGNVIGTLSVDDLTELVANNLVKSTQNQIAAARSVSTMSEASTLAASDDYENTLPIDANPASVRTLDSEGNPRQTGISAFAQVVGGLLGNSMLYPFMNRGIASGDVLRDELISGFYAVNSVLGAAENLPSDATEYGVFIKFVGLHGGYGHALYADNINFSLYINHRTESGWKGWKKVSLSSL